jgi:hypothetical protein
MPKNSPKELKIGKLSSFAYTSDGRFASGANLQNLIGGTNQNAPNDITPPAIRLFLGDTTFINGGVVGPNTKIVALLNDESGMNISAEPEGNSITAQIDQNDPIILNDYYSASIDTYKKGSLSGR